MIFTLIIIGFLLIIGVEILRGPSIITTIALGTFKLFETLALPESMGILLLFSLFIIAYTLKQSKKILIVFSAFLFSFIGLAWGIVTHYGVFMNFGYTETLSFIPYDPLDNSYRYISSYIPFLTIFSVYGIYLIGQKISNTFSTTNNKINPSHKIRTIFVSILVILIVVQSFYGLSLIVEKTQKDSKHLEESYNKTVQWLTSQGSPRVYTFNTNLESLYGTEKVVVLNDESLLEIARRASEEKIEYIVSDIFGRYSEAQLALYFGGYYNDSSYINLDRYQLMKSYSWPDTQIFKMTLVESNQTALVVEHNTYGGREWVSLLSRDFLVDSVDDVEELGFHFSGNYKLIVIAELRRTLNVEELEILRQKVAEGAILVICGISPAYLNLDDNSYWIGATEFIEAPRDDKWKIGFNLNSLDISTEIDINDQYIFYTDSNYSSPTGVIGLQDDVVVLANRIEDQAVAIYTKPYFDGTIIFNGIRLAYAKYSEDYEIITHFLEVLQQKAIDNSLFP